MTAARPALTSAAAYVFKQADTATEFQQIHRLNYRTFVDEVGQYASDGSGYLVDAYHDRNTYLIALRGETVVGMVAVQDRRPFSIEKRLSDPSVLNTLGERLLEVRLLAIEPKERFSRVFAGLLYRVYEYARVHKYSHLLISGVEDKLSIYQRLGFAAIGPAVTAGQTQFTPMAIAVGDFPGGKVRTFRQQALTTPRQCRQVSLLPGPVQISPEAREAFAAPPISHRGEEFLEKFADIRSCLSRMSGGLPTALFPGSGTLANDVVAAALANGACDGEGLVLVNGEFGARLLGHARRWKLAVHSLEWEWGAAWKESAIVEFLERHPQVRWVWGVHLETSSGVLNDVAGLQTLLAARGVRLCLDCVSSFGAVPTDLRGVALATGVSGKSLGSYAGVSFVFSCPEIVQRVAGAALPACLDLPRAIASDGPLFTFASPLVVALHAALAKYRMEPQRAACYERYRSLGSFVRRQLRLYGFSPLAAEESASPVVTTFSPAPGDTRAAALQRAATMGFLVAGESQYLVERNWLQIATMGTLVEQDIAPVFALLRPSECA